MKPFKVRLGWTRQRERPELFGPHGQIESRLWITGSRIGGFLTLGLGVYLWIALPVFRPFLVGAVAVGIVVGLALRWKHR